jgi:hypothetical protein
MLNILGRFKHAYYWLRATELYDKGKYDEVMDLARRDRELRGRDTPEFLVLKGHVMLQLDKVKEAAEDYFQAYASLKTLKWYPKDKQQYLMCFAAFQLHRIVQCNPWMKYEALPFRFDSFSLDRVPGFTKRLFPLPNHPQLDRDGSLPVSSAPPGLLQ